MRKLYLLFGIFCVVLFLLYAGKTIYKNNKKAKIDGVLKITLELRGDFNNDVFILYNGNLEDFYDLVNSVMHGKNVKVDNVPKCFTIEGTYTIEIIDNDGNKYLYTTDQKNITYDVNNGLFIKTDILNELRDLALEYLLDDKYGGTENY